MGCRMLATVLQSCLMSGCLFWAMSSALAETPSYSNYELVTRAGQGSVARSGGDAKSWESTQFPGRMIYLNGVNISGVREQELERVNVRIDAQGNLHITAPHYEATQESSYHPLLPSELPKYPKATSVPQGMPTGRFSKEKELKERYAPAEENSPVAKEDGLPQKSAPQASSVPPISTEAREVAPKNFEGESVPLPKPQASPKVLPSLPGGSAATSL